MKTLIIKDKSTGTYLKRPHFYLKKIFRYLNPFSISCRNFETRRIFYEGNFGGCHKWKFSKNPFFQNCLKFDLDGLRYRFLVQNTSKTPQESISGHILLSRPVSATLFKFEFLSKIENFAIFRFFWVSRNGLIFGRKWPEMWLVAENGLTGLPKHFYIQYIAYYDD